MIRKFKFDYDSENNSLFLYNPKSKSKGSIELDDLIIDFNSRKEITAIEILNATQFFKGLETNGFRITKTELKDIKESKLDIISKNNFLVIKFMLLFNSKNTFSTPIIVPMLKDQSPALMGV